VIIPADLLAPEGPVEVTMFPDEGTGLDGGKLNIRLDSYIDQGQAKVMDIALAEPELGVRAWALFLAFDAAYILACSRPNMENTMVEILGSKSYAKDQRDGLKALRDRYLEDYNVVLNTVVDVVNAIPRGYMTRAITNVYEY
jgi:hypothetical protein